MGLDLYVDGFHVARWAYSGFSRFRQRVAADIGINLAQMEGYVYNGIFWSTIEDALVPFLHHSDCDGVLSPEECERIAPRLKEIVSKWPENIEHETEFYPDYDREQGLRLAAGMENAAKLGANLEFR